MVRRAKPPEADTREDLENTSELPSLNVAAYEEQLAHNGDAGEFLDAGPELDIGRQLPVLPAAETLQDIDAWITAQDARSHAYQRSLEELHRSRAEAQARAESLAIELGVAQQALHSALSRANEKEREALDKATAANGADSHSELLQQELADLRRELAASRQRLSDSDEVLRQLRESQAARENAYAGLQEHHEALSQTARERPGQVAQLERVLAEQQTAVTGLQAELARRNQHIDTLQSTGAAHHSAATQLAQERDELSRHVAMLVENARSNTWRRGFWDCLWQEQDHKIAELSAQCQRAESARSELHGALNSTSAELAARESTIAQLHTQDQTQHAALEELGATRTRELQEVITIGETLAAEFKALEERHRVSVETLATREAELSAARTAQDELTGKLSTLEGDAALHGARIAELEAQIGSLGETLQRQTEAAQQAHELRLTRERELTEAAQQADELRLAHERELIESAQQANDLRLTRERELTEAQARASALESRLETTLQQLSEHAQRSQASQAELANTGALLASGEERRRALEQEAAAQMERMVQLQSELAAVQSAAQDTESAKQSREKELERLREAQQREVERAAALESAQRDLTLELERTRGALDERDLQVRRLERYANNSAQVLNRIQLGMQRGAGVRAPDKETTEYQASLVPMGEDAAPAVPLGRRTVIGRAPGNDVCLMDTSVSRRHAAVTIGPNGAFIEDLRSINGVKLNQRRVRVAQLSDGDVIELGAKSFRFTMARGRPRAETG